MAPRVQVSTDGAFGGISWRENGTELYYLSEILETEALDDGRVMAVAIGAAPLAIRECQRIFRSAAARRRPAFPANRAALM